MNLHPPGTPFAISHIAYPQHTIYPMKSTVMGARPVKFMGPFNLGEAYFIGTDNPQHASVISSPVM